MRMAMVYKIIPPRHPLYRASMKKGSGLRSQKTSPPHIEIPSLIGLVYRPAGDKRGRTESVVPSLFLPSPLSSRLLSSCLTSFVAITSPHPRCVFPSRRCLQRVHQSQLPPESPPPRLVGGNSAHARSVPLPLHPQPPSASGPHPLLSVFLLPLTSPDTDTPLLQSPHLSFGLQHRLPEALPESHPQLCTRTPEGHRGP